MPNREYRRQRLFEEFWPENWKDLPESTQKRLSDSFLYYSVNERNRSRIIEHFKPENWRELNQQERGHICKRLESVLAFENQRPPCSIIVGTTGQPANMAFQRRLRQDNPYKVLETVVHLSCHADHQDLIANRKTKGNNAELNRKFNRQLSLSALSEDDLIVIDWEKHHPLTNRDSVSRIGTIDLCNMQLGEVDCLLQSVRFLKEISGVMEGQEGFREYFRAKEDSLQRLQSTFWDDRLVRSWFKDRRERFPQTNVDKFSRSDLSVIEGLYSSEDFANCDFRVLKDLQSWRRTPKTQHVYPMSLGDFVTEKGVQQEKRSAEISLEDIKVKKAKFSLG